MLRCCTFKYRRQYCTINYKKLQKSDVNKDNLSSSNNIIYGKDDNRNVGDDDNLSKRNEVEKSSATATINKQQLQCDSVNAQTRQSIKRMLSKWQPIITSTHPENDVNFVSGQTELIFRKIMNNIDEITHMKEVRLAQEHVRQVRKRLLATNNEKRRLMTVLDDVRAELNNIYRDMKAANNRSPEKYLQLTHQEIELIQKEKQLIDEFTKLDDEEQRILHYELSIAINDSYEKEKIHTNFIKVLGFMLAILGSFVTFLGTLISYIYQQNRYGLLVKEVDAIVSQKISGPMSSVNRLLKSLDEKKERQQESWGSYIKRHTSWTYSWAMRKS